MTPKIICNNEVLPDDFDPLEKIYKEYLKQYDLNFDDFKNIRKKYNLSQKMFSKILVRSKKTVIRYENKASFHQKIYLDTYNSLKHNKSYFVNFLIQRKKKLKKDYYNILEKSGLYNHVKTINCFLFMLDKNDLYSTALMKNMFALDFYFNKTYNVPITSLHYAKAPFGPIIDNHDEIINYLINNGYISVVLNDDDKIKFKSNLKYDDNMFTEKELNSMRYVKDKLLGKSSVSLSDWSHKFIGWKETKNGKIISFSKYKNEFNIETLN